MSVLLFVLLQAATPEPVPGVSAADGVYYQQRDMKVTKLEPAPIVQTKTKGMEMFIQTHGLSNLGTTVVYRGAQALAHVSDPRPTFHVRGVGASKDALIIELSIKRDSRTLETSSKASAVGNSGGFKRGQIHRVTATVYSDESFSVKPEEDLKPGEYLLVLGSASACFDFGVSPRKK